MSSRAELLTYLWREVIDSNLHHNALTNIVQDSERSPNGPFADHGRAIARLLALGADPVDIQRIQRAAAYDAVFATLYALDDPGVDDGDVFMLHEELLTADPSGRDGRPPT